jgi:hypothetical protein
MVLTRSMAENLAQILGDPSENEPHEENPQEEPQELCLQDVMLACSSLRREIAALRSLSNSPRPVHVTRV